MNRRFAPRRWPSVEQRARITRQGVAIETVALGIGILILIVLLGILAVGR